MIGEGLVLLDGRPDAGGDGDAEDRDSQPLVLEAKEGPGAAEWHAGHYRGWKPSALARALRVAELADLAGGAMTLEALKGHADAVR